MKIAILEDRMERLKKFLDIDLKEYPEITVITGKEFDGIAAGLQRDNTTSIAGYDCLAAHRSGLPAEAVSTLSAFCKATRKPLILFSGGISTNVLKEREFPFLLINSKDFYSSHLTTFMEDGKHNGHFNLNVLQFGHRWKLSLLLNLRNHLVVGRNNKSIKRVKDCKIPERILTLLNEKTGEILPANELAPLSADQVDALIRTIGQLTIEMA